MTRSIQTIRTPMSESRVMLDPTPLVSASPLREPHERYLPPLPRLSQVEHDRALDVFFDYNASWGES
jgi:hypothetical protein